MTVQQIGRGLIVDAPTPARRTGGLLDVADVHEGMAWLDPNDMFISWNCADTHATEVCATDSTPAKTFTGPTVVDGTDFVVYLGGQCKPLSEDFQSDIDRVFDLRESRAVEKAFEAAVLATGTAVSGTPVSAAHALAMMENALGDQYAGIGTIHISLLVATMLLADNLLIEQGGKFYTKLGTKVVVGAGYNSTVLYGTGDVTLYRSAKVLVDGPDMANNVTSVLAERAYVAVADCVSLKLEGVPAPSGTQAEPQTQALNVSTGTDTVEGPGGVWTPPAGNLRNVSVVVTSGSVEVDGDEVTAPNTVNFDADTGEFLAPPVVTANSSGDKAVVAWTVIP